MGKKQGNRRGWPQNKAKYQSVLSGSNRDLKNRPEAEIDSSGSTKESTDYPLCREKWHYQNPCGMDLSLTVAMFMK